jgi:hypothetical protein
VIPAPEPADASAPEPEPIRQPALDAAVPPEPEGELSIGPDPCTRDEDCVPEGCCHAKACVARGRAPDCSAVMCTMECRPGTLDCGGRCLCQEGRCAARLVLFSGPR